MLSFEDASKIIEQNALGKIKAAVKYKKLYIFQVIDDDDEAEGPMDPFYSVDSESGAFSDFSVLTDIDISEFADLMENDNLVKEK